MNGTKRTRDGQPGHLPVSFPSEAVTVLFLALAALWMAGCGRKRPAQPMGGAPEVVVETVTAQALPLIRELPGRIDPVRVAQVRARVTGVVLERKFDQGSNVKAGQVLYRIDPALYQAALDNAAAGVAQAEATLTQAQQLAERYQPLVGIDAVSKQTYDNAVAAAAQAKASVAAARATEETARINLAYCTVTAPISGRIGLALVTEGALVSQSAATEMAVIQQMDPIYFDFTESSAEALKLREQVASGQLKSLPTGEPKVTLALPDGTIYPNPGKLLVTDITVDPTSGMITLRAEFPNPENWLLPGMFTVGRVELAVAPQTLLVPQPAVVIGANGQASVMRVAPTDEAETQPVELGPAMGTNWVVKAGLNPGDRVIVEGLQKVHPMRGKPAPVKPVEKNSVPPAAGK
jgi:membrane fusion protein, multidrug efflux system